MKKSILSLLACSLFFACKKAPESEIVPNPEPEKVTVATSECYAYIKGKDTIMATLTTEGDKVSGNLAYKFFEKDKSSGAFAGTVKGDTIIGEYNFAAEGSQSVREVVFLKKNNSLIEGYGDIEDKNGKVVFKDKSKLKFTESLVLDKTDCK